MVKKIFLLFSIILLVISACSKEDDPFIVVTNPIDDYDYVRVDTINFLPALDFSLTLDKEQYHPVDLVKIIFRVNGPIILDAGFTTKLIFTNTSKFRIQIYKDTLLVFNYPQEITESNPDTVYLPVIFNYNWNQIDNNSKQVEDGLYTINASLIQKDYSQFIKQKVFSIHK